MRDRKAPALAGAFLLLAALVVAASPEQRLALSAADGTTLMSASALTLRYRHSVERTIVEEDYLPGPSGVRVVETRFESFGAGLPSQPEWRGRFVTLPDGRLAVRDMQVSLDRIAVRVGEVSEQAVVRDGIAVPLASLATPGEVLTFRSVTRPRVLWWLAQ